MDVGVDVDEDVATTDVVVVVGIIVDAAKGDPFVCLADRGLMGSTVLYDVPSIGLAKNTVDEGFSPISDDSRGFEDAVDKYSSFGRLSIPVS